MTRFVRFFSGLNFSGMLSHVFRPMITAFMLPSGAFIVVRAKYDISLGRRQGRVPFFPMPFVSVAATMSVSRGIPRVKSIQRNMRGDDSPDQRAVNYTQCTLCTLILGTKRDSPCILCFYSDAQLQHAETSGFITHR